MRAMRCKFLRKILHNIHRAIITLTVVVLPVSIAILVSVAGLGPMSRSFIGSFSVNRDNSFYGLSRIHECSTRCLEAG